MLDFAPDEIKIIGDALSHYINGHLANIGSSGLSSLEEVKKSDEDTMKAISILKRIANNPVL
jgi:hypothetical protein